MIHIYSHIGDTTPVLSLDRRYHTMADALGIVTILQHRWGYAWCQAVD